MTETIRLDVEDVYPNPKHYREIDPADVKTLAASIAVIGQLEPVTVFADGDIYIVDSGHHRLEAVKSLGLDTIDAIVIDDVDEARSASVMVASNMHFPVTELERSRGTQLMLATGVRPAEAAALIGERSERVARAARGWRLAADYAEDMTLDRLVAVAEFEDDPDAAKKLMTCPEAEWRRVYDTVRREKAIAEGTARAEAIVKASGCELIIGTELNVHRFLARGDEMPEGAKWARIVPMTWSGSVEITWYGEMTEDAEDPEEAAERERQALTVAALEKAAEARVAFLLGYITSAIDSLSNSLREFASEAWDAGWIADVEDIDEALEGVHGFFPRVYAAILSRVETEAAALLRYRNAWNLKRDGETVMAYFAALEAAGYEVSPDETAALAWVEAAVKEADDDE